MAIHLPLNFMSLSLLCFLFCPVLSLLPPCCCVCLQLSCDVPNHWTAGHAAPVTITIKCCLTSTHSIPLSLLMLCCLLACLCCYYFVCSQQQYRKSYRFGNQLKAQDWPNNFGIIIPAFNWLVIKQKMNFI